MTFLESSRQKRNTCTYICLTKMQFLVLNFMSLGRQDGQTTESQIIISPLLPMLIDNNSPKNVTTFKGVPSQCPNP